jgi:lipopolysaccharide transport system permease protein
LVRMVGPGQTPPVPARSGTWAQKRDVIRELVARDMQLRYRGSLLGMAWTLLNPLTELLVLTFVFSSVLPINLPNYPAFLFTGLLAFNWFSTALVFATGAIVNNRELIKNPGVPVLVLPIVTTASTLAHFVISLPVLFALLLLTGVDVGGAVVLLPLLMMVQFLLILTFAYPLATVNVWFRDTEHFLRVGLQLLFYLTPVFYEPSMVPERFSFVHRLNPLSYVIDGYRAVLIRDEVPSVTPLLALIAITGCGLIAGVAAFQHASVRFADEL